MRTSVDDQMMIHKGTQVDEKNDFFSTLYQSILSPISGCP